MVTLMISNEMKEVAAETYAESPRRDEDELNIKAMVRSDLEARNPYESN